MTGDYRPSTDDWYRPLWAAATTTGIGAAAWIFIALAGGRREAWDSELYFVLAIPAIALTAAIVSFLVPQRFWRWAMLPFAGQALASFLQNPTANLLPLGLVVFAILAAICMIPAALGAALGRWASR
jgi:hypothetical protein